MGDFLPLGCLQGSLGFEWSQLSEHLALAWRGSYNKGFYVKISGNEAYHTILWMLLVKKMLCSNLHYQKVLIGKPIHVKSAGWP